MPFYDIVDRWLGIKRLSCVQERGYRNKCGALSVTHISLVLLKRDIAFIPETFLDHLSQKLLGVLSRYQLFLDQLY